MAEFCYVMQQWAKMCIAFGSACRCCPLVEGDRDYCIGAWWSQAEAFNWKETELRVMTWAAKNSEQKYPLRKGGEVGMTISEAILTLNANVVVACGRAEFDSATVKMVEDALDTIEGALQAQEPRVMTISDFKDEGVYYLEALPPFVLRPVIYRLDYSDPRHYNFVWKYDQFTWNTDDYGITWRCWTSRPTDEQREAIPWE